VQLPLPKSLSVALLVVVFGVASATAAAQTVLITGANQGIGLEFAKEYAARGWTVIATHRRSTTPEELAELAAKYPKKVRVERMDVTDAPQIEALGAKLKGVPIDVLLNNAGLVRTDPIDKPGGNTNQMFGTLDYKLLDEFIHTNVAGPLKICETFIGNVRASRRNGDLQIILSRPPLPTHLGGIAQTGNRPQGAATAEASRAQPVLGSSRL
jgi:NAD(P)-dependent dehydrogenase (short-subunit alcohol dehydrogenase family)